MHILYIIIIIVPVTYITWLIGKLEAVTDLNITESPGQLFISWRPPFTLILSDRVYSITYAIDINEESSGKDYLIANNITETQYTFNIRDSQIIITIPFTVTVTPENPLGKGREKNASVSSYIIYDGCQYNCYYNGNISKELSVHQIIGQYNIIILW